MDLSALIFVALAVAWAVYLVPKALRHHEEDAISRGVESFSDRMRVLARREAVSAARAELVVPGRKSAASVEVAVEVDIRAESQSDAQPEPAAPTPLQRRARRAAAARAAARRRRVLGLVLLANVVVVALASAAVVGWAWAAVPALLLVGWLVACRLMVKKERAAAPVVVRKRRRTLADEELATDVDDEALGDDTSEIDAVAADDAEAPTPGGWDPVPMTLPTYVAKAPAGRTVRTIDLDATGVWSSGRNAADSQLAREAEAAEAAADRSSEQSSGDRRVSGA